MRSFLVALLVIVLGCTAVAQPNPGPPVFADAIDYNNYIIGQQDLIANYYEEFATLIEDTNTTKAIATKKRLELLAKTRVCANNLKSMPPWQGNTELRDSAVVCFTFYVQMFEVEYTAILDLLFVEPLTDKEIDGINAIDKRTMLEEDRLNKMFYATQKRFAKQFDFIIDEE